VQKKFNYALKSKNKEEFIEQVTDGILPPPSYFFEDARINKQGYDSIESVMKSNNNPLSVQEFKDAVAKGAIILDTRNPDDFESGFVNDSLNIGLNGQYAVWVGTLIDIKKSLVLVADPGKEAEAILRLARVGYENVVGYLKGGVSSWPEKLQTVKSIAAEDMKEQMNAGAEVLDVRKPGEWSSGHLEEAKFYPLANMPSNLIDLDKSKTYVVHCGGGYRSMMAISLMRKLGFTKLINVYGGFGAMVNAGMKVVSESVVA
jgi:rhodanese-related sulfurtransferase